MDGQRVQILPPGSQPPVWTGPRIITPISLLAVGQETEDDQKRLKRLMEDRKKLSKEKLLSHYGVEGDLDFDALEKFLRRDENSPDPLAWMTSTISTAASAQVADRAALFKALNAPHLAQIKQKQRSRKNLMRYYDVTMTQVWEGVYTNEGTFPLLELGFRTGFRSCHPRFLLWLAFVGVVAARYSINVTSALSLE